MAAGAAMLASACSRQGGDPNVIRIGYLANLSHAPMLTGILSGRIQSALRGVRVETRVFRAGPRVVEALIGRAIDVGVTGPAPVVIAHARHGPGTLSIASGLASGGASFIVSAKSRVRGPRDLRGKTVASVQIGSTMDIALRKYVREGGLDFAEHGGDVNLVALAAPTILLELASNDLAGAWLPEPWATRAVREGGGTRLVDERDRWPDHAFSAALLVARGDYAKREGETLGKLAGAIDGEISLGRKDPAALESETYAAIKALTGNPGANAVFHEALARVDFTSDPLPDAVEAFAADACALGLIPPVACGSLFPRA